MNALIKPIASKDIDKELASTDQGPEETPAAINTNVHQGRGNLE